VELYALLLCVTKQFTVFTAWRWGNHNKNTKDIFEVLQLLKSDLLENTDRSWILFNRIFI